jgi:hypothetical protein
MSEQTNQTVKNTTDSPCAITAGKYDLSQLGQDVTYEVRGQTTFAVNVNCPGTGCTKVFKALPVSKNSTIAYIATHALVTEKPKAKKDEQPKDETVAEAPVEQKPTRVRRTRKTLVTS